MSWKADYAYFFWIASVKFKDDLCAKAVSDKNDLLFNAKGIDDG